MLFQNDLIFFVIIMRPMISFVQGCEYPAHKRSPRRIKRDLEEADIVPKIIKVSPHDAVQVIFPEHEAHFGTIIGPSYAKDAPHLIWPADPREYYTVVMTSNAGLHIQPREKMAAGPDVDCMSLHVLPAYIAMPKQEVRDRSLEHVARYYRRKAHPDDDRLPMDSGIYQWQYWLVVNIPGGNVLAGETISPYVGPRPEMELRFHRLVIVVFMQPVRLDFKAEKRNTSEDDLYRANFRTQRFADKYNLYPVAANFFHTEWIEWTPITESPDEEKVTKSFQNPFEDKKSYNPFDRFRTVNMSKH